jgi:metal-responsive CopG/Arc/MetJ family transcriptional regulator
VAKINIDSNLLERAKKAAQDAGYSGVEEFVAHCIENEIKRHQAERDVAEEQVSNQLRGLGYIE